MKKIFFPLALLCSSALLGEVFLDLSSKEEVKKLKIESGTVSVLESGVRFQVNADAKGRTGFISRRVKVPKTGGFLQLEQPNIEDAGAAPFLSDKSKNGRSLGPVNIGLNTYDLSYRKGQNFVLSLRQRGARNQQGPWADYRYFRITETPKGAVLASVRGGKDVLSAGDTLDFVYYPSQKLNTLKAEIVVVPGFIPYFSVELKADARGVLRGSYTLPATLPGFHSTGKLFLAARSNAEGIASTSIFGFPVRIDGKEQLDVKGAFIPATPAIRKAREEWAKLTRGTNLALGKKVALVPQATYSLNRDGNDESDLTDGKLSARSDDRIWFDRHAVGWQSSPCCMKIDLGEVKPVGSTVVRMLGGAGKIGKFPSSFEVFISKDGENWYPASELKKLQPGEKEQSDWKTTYYLDESTDVFVWPFALEVNAEARYVLLRATSGARATVCDEWAVLAGDPAASGFNAAYRNPCVKIPLAGLIAQVRAGVLAVAKDLPMAQFIQLTDLRDEKAKKRPAKIVVELPAGVEVCPTEKNPLVVTKLPDGGTKVEFSWKNLGRGEPPAVYFKTAKDAVSGKAAVYAICDGKEQFRSEYPVQVLEFPEFEPFQKLHISLAWIGEAYQRNWPDFFRVWKRLGFNWICVFPAYHKSIPEPESLAFCEAGKKQGFKLLMNLNVLPELARKGAKTKEFFCGGNKNSARNEKRICPSYRKEAYRQEMERVAGYVAAYKPQAFFDDNEVWTYARTMAPKCPRCQEAQKKSGRSWEDFLFSCGAGYAADLKKAIETGAKRGNCKVELIGSYGRAPSQPVYQIQRFSDIYPASIDHSQPSLYVAGRADIVRDKVRANCRAQKNKAQIPFLTAGTYGEFSSEKMELMVLESFLNGSCGITFYKYSTFDTPLDFYYMSKALALLRPYEEFILNSELAELPLSNGGLSVSALRRGNELLVLVVNYTGAKPETVLTLPVEGKVTDLVAGKAVPVSGKKVSLSVPSGKFKLLHVK